MAKTNSETRNCKKLFLKAQIYEIMKGERKAATQRS